MIEAIFVKLGPNEKPWVNFVLLGQPKNIVSLHIVRLVLHAKNKTGTGVAPRKGNPALHPQFVSGS